jgi:hypothetical protein
MKFREPTKLHRKSGISGTHVRGGAKVLHRWIVQQTTLSRGTRNNNLPVAEETGVQRKCSGAKQNQGYRDNSQTPGRRGMAVRRSAHIQVGNRRCKTREWRQKPDQQRQPHEDGKGGAQHSTAVREHGYGNRDSQTNKADPRPSSRERGEKPLHRTRLARAIWNWTPISSAFSLTPYSWMIPRRTPIATASVRSPAPSFSMMCLI